MKQFFSRRQVITKSLLAGSSLAIGGALPAMAEKSIPQSPIPNYKPVQLTPKQSGVATASPLTNYTLLSGLDFKPLISTTSYSYTNYTGLYGVSNLNYFAATVVLPDHAKITEVEFYTLHNVANAPALFYFGTIIPTTQVEPAAFGGSYNAVSPGVITLSVSIPADFPKNNSSLAMYGLYWFPGTAGVTDVLYGARIGYTGGTAHFGA